MNLATRILLLCSLIHVSDGKFRDKVVTRKEVCISSAHLPNSQTFTPVADATDCALLFLSTSEKFMLVRYGADSAVECGFTSTLPSPVSCGTGDIVIYSDVKAGPICLVSSVTTIQLRGITYCVHMPSIPERNYAEAEKHCQSIGGMVLELEKKADLSILGLLGSPDLMWLGADDNQIQGEYRWKSGGLISPDMFRSNEPNQVSERCVGSFNGGHLADIKCSVQATVVCAVPAQ